MTTLAFALIAAASFLLWRRNDRWAWPLVIAALIVGAIVFVGDVDFSSKLGIQL
jgi:hypothetical protein